MRKDVLHVVIFIAHVNVIQLTELFWRDDTFEAYVMDNLFTKELIEFRTQFKQLAMQFNCNSEAYSSNFSILGGFKTKYVPRQYKTKYLLKLTEKVKSIYPNTGNLSISAIGDYIMERNDFNPIITQCSNDISELVVIIILNKVWGKNDYGDFAIYNNEGEIIMSFHPKLARVIFMRCGTKYKLTPPSISKEQRLNVRFIEYTTKHHRKLSNSQNTINLGEFLHKAIPQITPKGEKDINISEYVTNRMETAEKKLIYVFDNLFPEDLVRNIYLYVKDHAEYFEEEIEEQSDDNVRWILDMDFPKFVQSPIWNILKQTITYISGIDTFYPYDITCNHIRRTDITTIHTDCASKEKEYTSLIYLNPDWNSNLHGETIFLEKNEYFAAVTPKFGRLVVFDGTIEHSARPPSLNVNEARLSFAVKSAIDAETARKKKR